MKIKFLGTSAAHSSPLPFCNCSLCETARNLGGKNLRKRSSLLVNDDLIIDIGQDLMTASYMHNVDTTKIRYWLQTHSHTDHFSASHLITRMEEYANINTKPLSLFASSACIKNMSKHLDKEWNGVNLLENEWQQRLNINVNCVKPNNEFVCGSYAVTALFSAHDVNDGSYMYLINDNTCKLFYGIDADKHTLMTETIKYFSENNICIDVVVLDHTYGKVNANDHLNTNSFIEVITEMKNRKIINENTKVYASHISHEGTLPHDEFVIFANENGYNVAFDGLVLDV